MKRTLIAGAVVAALFAGIAWAQMGPGMMGGYGPGGGYRHGYGMGPGMMGDYGPGYGMGPGMMGGYGPGYGMGAAMMGGYGPGMMAGYGWGGYGGLKLSDEQRTKIAAIQDEFSRRQWSLMSNMHEQRNLLFKLDPSAKEDESTARKTFQAMSDVRKAMFENSLDMRKRVDAVLTKEQREQLQSGTGCW